MNEQNCLSILMICTIGDTYLLNMIRFKFGKILTGFIFLTLASFETKAQCKDKTEPAGTVAGEFSINGTKVQVRGDGDGNTSNPNNIPVKICEGETITLKNTIPATSTSGVSYWIMPATQYSALASPPSNPLTATASYLTLAGSADVNINTSASWYTGPGFYVITQGDNSGTGTTSDYHHACQVIEIIQSATPVVTANICSSSDMVVSLPQNTNNNYPSYEITYYDFDGGLLQTSLVQPTTYPYKENFLLPDNNEKTVVVVGNSQTGVCPAQPFSKTLDVSSGIIYRPTIIELSGTSVSGEFNLKVTTQDGLKRNVFMRESPTTPNYNFTATPFLSYQSDASLAVENRKFTVPNAQKQYCFIVEAVNEACPVTSVDPNNLSAEELCTTPLQAVAADDQNELTWGAASTASLSGSFTEYKVERLLADGSLDVNFPARTFNNIGKLTFTDTDVKCGRDYYYQVSTNYGALSTSGIVKVTAKSSVLPTKIPLVYADVDAINQNVIVKGDFVAGLQPEVADIKKYNFYRADASNSYGLLNSATANTLTDNAVQINNQSYCYYVTWTNQCNLESLPSEPVCSILLNSNSTDLKWTPNLPFSTNIEFYRVNKVDPTTGTIISVLINKLFTSSVKLADLPDSEGQEIYVQIESKPTNTSWGVAPTSRSNIYRLFRPVIVSIPQVFTPNVDGYNDSFVVYGKYIQKLKMTIFDRWGNPIFYAQTDDYVNNPQLGWDGSLKSGLPAQEGTYIYKIEVEDTVGQITMKEGTVFLTH